MSTPTPTAAQARQLAARTLAERLRRAVWDASVSERFSDVVTPILVEALTAASAAQEAELQQLRHEVAAYGVRFGRLHNESAEDHAASIANIIGQREARLTAQEAEIAKRQRILDRCHEALGEAVGSADETIPEGIAAWREWAKEMDRRYERAEAEIARLSNLYHELLYQVARTHPNESRHETALRYIRQQEAGCACTRGVASNKGASRG